MVKRTPATIGLEWVEARTNNYEELKRFYRRVLGLTLNLEEEDKEFVLFKVGSSKTHVALLDTKKTGASKSIGFIPTFEVPDLKKFIRKMKRNGVKVGEHMIEGDHVRLVDFYDPSGNTLQAFQWKRRQH